MNKQMLTKNTKKHKYKRRANYAKDGKQLEVFKDSFKGDNLGGTLAGMASGVLGGVTAGIEAAQIDSSEADNALEAVNNFEPDNSSLDAIADSYNNLDYARNDWTGKDFTKSTGEQLMGMAQAGLSGASTGIGGDLISASIGAGLGILGSGIGWAVGAAKAKNKAQELNDAARLANLSATSKMESAIENQQELEANNIMRNVVAKGGRIFTKPNNKFKSGGAMHQHGGIFSNGVISIDNGGTHEENPLEGVQIGVDYEGIPNLVEEGEVIWNDYVFSNRLKVPGKKHTFAVEVEKLQEESEERPYDSISKRGLEDSMLKLIQEQENVRQKDSVNSSNKFDKGGMKNKKSKSTRNVFNSLTQQLFDRYKYIDRLGYHTVEEGKELEAQERLKRELGVPSTTPPPSNFIEGLLDKVTGEGMEEYKTGPKRKFDKGSWLRYMPAVGSGLSVLSDAFGLTNKPDYSNIEGIKEATNAIKQVGYKPVDTKMTYNPFDTQFYGAKLAEQNAATKQAIQNTAQTSGQAIAGLLAADYNNVGKLGDLYRQAEEYNQAQREKVLGFNRQTDAMNSEMAMKAAIANQANDKLRLSSAITQAQMKDQIDTQANAGRSANLSNLFTNLGSIGTDIFNRQQSDMLLSSGVYGTLSMKPAWWSDKQWADYQAGLAAQRETPTTPTTPTIPANQGTPVGLGPSTGTIDEDDAWWRYRDEDLEYAKGGKIKRRRKIKKGLTY
jgi:hypothetical protein